MAEQWIESKIWPELILDKLEGEGVARIIFNRPKKGMR